MRFFLKILLFLCLLQTYSTAEKKCSEIRLQWIKFYKKDFAQNFYEINYSDDPCLVSVVSLKFSKNDEKVFISESQNVNQKIIQKLPNDLDINWVPEYFEIDAKEDYIYGAQYFASKKYDEAALFLSDYLEKNPKDKLAAKGQYLYAETFKLREDYIEAATQYLTGYEKFIESEFKPLYVLRLGEMMIKIDYPETGCELLNNVQNEVPPVNDDIYLETEQLMKTYKCPKVVTTNGEIMLANLIKDTKKILN